MEHRGWVGHVECFERFKKESLRRASTIWEWPEVFRFIEAEHDRVSFALRAWTEQTERMFHYASSPSAQAQPRRPLRGRGACPHTGRPCAAEQPNTPEPARRPHHHGVLLVPSSAHRPG